MGERKLTKAHKFNFELKYRNYLITKIVRFKEELTIDLLDNLTRIDIFYLFSYNTELVYQFIDDYKDVINWYELIASSITSINNNGLGLEKFLDRYNDYFYKSCWTFISKYIDADYSNQNIFIKYKDKIKWEYVNFYNFRKFEIDTILQLKDYINFKVLLDDEYDDNLTAQMKIYTLDHLEEVLNYKREVEE